MSSLITYSTLLAAIVLEVIATSFLQKTEQFTKLVPTLITGLGYAGAFYCLSIALKTLPVSIAYAIWSGLGIVLIAAVGWIFFKQKLDTPAIIGLAFIIIGVVIVNGFSKSIAH
ncbi:multidrug efflux SMR transporter [Verrucomicrobium sp. BvORR106]|uniref:DMT family transporter n=1 Tax=Verrucomicrobium sp. BvORR106 TaxID=1403819 RepID=UPI000571F880|nr:multidrug efflux SMR transporter [Verrucomicrobium sp. BvORR106]